jgi:hypothetical protein
MHFFSDTTTLIVVGLVLAVGIIGTGVIIWYDKRYSVKKGQRNTLTTTREWLTTGLVDFVTDDVDDAMRNPNTPRVWRVVAHQTQIVSGVTGIQHSIPDWRNPTLNEIKALQRRIMEHQQEHPDIIAPGDPSLHTKPMLGPVPDAQIRSVRAPATVLPEGARIVTNRG